MKFCVSLQFLPLVLCAATLTLLAGCPSTGRTMHAVRGTLTHRGKPIPKMQVCFEPVDADKNPASSGVTDENGKFELEVGNTSGVAPGEYIVYVSDPLSVMGGTTSDEEAYQTVLKKYGDVETSKLKITIEAAKYDYELKLD